MTKWHTLTVKNTLATLNSTKKGLSQTEVLLRQKRYGLNKLPENKGPSNLKIFLSQFNSLLVYILIAAGIITFVMHEKLDATVIFLAVIVNAIFGYWEEKKTINIMEKLKSILNVQVSVYRDGKKQIVKQEELVPGDIIEVSAGDKVPADARIIEADNLMVSEAVITGESVASRKQVGPLPEDTALADRKNMLYMGSLVESGKGLAVVIATGVNTETGKIVDFVQNSKEEKSPLQVRLDKFSKEIAIIIGGVAFLIFIGGLLRGDNPIKIFEAGVAIAVGGIPESLPIVMTLVLVIGMDRILSKKGLIRKLQSVETLGSTSVICFDKTKTLTKGKMELVKTITSTDEAELFKIATITSEAEIESYNSNKIKLIGSSTGKAIVEGAFKKGYIKNHFERHVKTIIEVPFDSKYKFIIKLVEDKRNNKQYIYVIGAPERILQRSKPSKNTNWKQEFENMMKQGLKTIGVAKKEVRISHKITRKNILEHVKDMEFIGLLGLIDPIRPGIKSAIHKTTTAGIRPIIITGDHELTARAIAKDAGINVKEGEYIEGIELNKLSDTELSKKLKTLKLCARAEPSHKMRIVKILQKEGYVVAMVGDGVNDAPAIKKADIGVALGSGTEVAKEASDLVLLNDSFAVIVNAVEQGRVILDNLRKSIAYIMADAFSSVIVVGVSNILLGWPLPILPVQILWNNLVEDSVPSIAYAFEPKEDGVMKRKPEPKEKPLLTREMKMLIFGTGLLDEFLTLAVFWYAYEIMHLDLTHVRTLIFGTMSIDTAFVIYAYKNLGKNIWHIDLFSNKWLIASSVIVFISYAAAVYIPFLNKMLHTIPIGVYDWVFLIVFGFISLAIIEITKIFYIRSKNQKRRINYI